MKWVNILLGMLMAACSLALSVIITLNLTIVYKLSSYKLNLAREVGLSSDQLMKNYNTMISYLRNPFIDKLRFNDFTMSINGEIHFEEVKRIFMMLYIVIIVFVVGYIVLKCIKRTSEKIKGILVLNYCSNTIIAFFIIGAMAMFIDFSKAFVVFHKIFFRNDYWIFDASTDPIINVLPESLFMIYGIVVIGILLVQAIIYKLVYYKVKA